jgi:DNA polymerase III, epsilon subunit and related 3''-5'' exonucleases
MSNSLDALCKRFNVDLSRRIKHNAVLDCELLREVYIYLLDVKEPKLSFNSKVEQKNSYRNILNYSKKIVKLSEEELKNHGKFLKSELKKNYF